ncbi:MAG: hypothetical protein H7836_04420 [Magnetococcus sp. YQC-3]
MAVKEYLSWVRTMVLAPREKRWEWVRLIFEGMKSYRPKNSSAKESIFLSDALQDKDTWELVGFSTNLQYVRVDHAEDEMLEAVFVHPWGTPPLLLKHKRLPMFVIAGPGIRWNDTILRELKDNKVTSVDLEGASG